ncbi:MAG: carbohydrate-binding family 9-like protein, partial [Candidatus Latescibacterota bacterium]|nr:carbohydrate-binding family 9-like protein [Candidatus Latescibacterota bacterium]
DAYFNFEFNCGGTMLLRRCSSTVEREWGRLNPMLAESDASVVSVAASMPRIVEPEIAKPTTWCLEFHVPLSLFQQYFVECPPPREGTEWKGNLYKCGGDTSHPHWGSWAPITAKSPSFHEPAFFQALRFA